MENSLAYSALHVFFGYLAVQGIVLAVLIWKKYGRGISDYFVAISFLFASLLGFSILFWTGQASKINVYLQFPILNILLFGPLFYGMQRDIKFQRLFRGWNLLQFLPFLAWYYLLVSGLVFRYNLYYHLGIALHISIYLILNTVVFIQKKASFSSGRRTVFFCYVGFSLLYLVFEIVVINNSYSLVFDYAICMLMGVFISIMLLKSFFNYDFQFRYKPDNKTSEKVSKEIGEVALYHLSEKKKFLEGSYKLTDLSRDSGFSVNLLSEALNTQHGGYYKLVHDLRIDEAKKLLKETDMQVIEVAYSSGFNNKVSFYNSFKKETGTTPVKWRESLRRGELKV